MLSLLLVLGFLVVFAVWWRLSLFVGYVLQGWVIVEGTRGFRGAAWFALLSLVLMMIVRPWPVAFLVWLLLVPYTRARA